MCSKVLRIVVKKRCQLSPPGCNLPRNWELIPQTYTVPRVWLPVPKTTLRPRQLPTFGPICVIPRSTGISLNRTPMRMQRIANDYIRIEPTTAPVGAA